MRGLRRGLRPRSLAIASTALTAVIVLSATALALPKDGEETYKTVCSVCHAAGIGRILFSVREVADE